MPENQEKRELSFIEEDQIQILSEEEILLISKNATEIPFLFILDFSVKEIL